MGGCTIRHLLGSGCTVFVEKYISGVNSGLVDYR